MTACLARVETLNQFCGGKPETYGPRKISEPSEFMSRASRLIKRLDKALNRYDSFGDHPDSFVETVMSGLETELDSIRSKDKPELWAEIYVERDRARIKQEVLNRVMGKGSD